MGFLDGEFHWIGLEWTENVHVCCHDREMEIELILKCFSSS